MMAKTMSQTLSSPRGVRGDTMMRKWVVGHGGGGGGGVMVLVIVLNIVAGPLGTCRRVEMV